MWKKQYLYFSYANIDGVESHFSYIEKNLGESVVTKINKLNYKYIEEEEKQVELKENDKKKLKW